MKRFRTARLMYRFVCALSIVAVIVFCCKAGFASGPSPEKYLKDVEEEEDVCPAGCADERRITLAAAACGDRLEEALVMIKSAVLLSRKKLDVIIFTENALADSFEEAARRWPESVRNRTSLRVKLVQYPSDGHEREWKTLFQPCASQRLFLSSALAELDSVLYVDTDVLFMAPVEELWSKFAEFNSSHLASAVPEHEDPAAGWYNRFARHPFFKPLGINSGVMLMNLTRMRGFKWEEYLLPIYQRYRLNLTWGDQDIINILFSFHPDKLKVFDCRWNYRPDHCMYTSTCKSAEEDGIALIHGNRGYFHNDKQPVFKAAYDAFRDLDWDSSVKETVDALSAAILNQNSVNTCGKLAPLFVKNVQKYATVF